jgi:hypothetical protein
MTWQQIGDIAQSLTDRLFRCAHPNQRVVWTRFSNYGDEYQKPKLRNFCDDCGRLVAGALILLAQAAGCPVLVVDHYGKDEERGLIGSAAKEAAAHFVLGSGGDRESRTDRQLEVKKMKDGPAYICVDFDLDTYDVTLSKRDVQEDGAEVVERQTHTTLVIKWGQEVRPIDATSKGGQDGERLSDLQRTALIKLITLINTEGAEIPPGLGAPVGMRGIHIERWFERLSRGRVLGERGQSEAKFKKLLMALQAKHQIEVHEPWVWAPIAPKTGE